jgi:hypothetical protein
VPNAVRLTPSTRSSFWCQYRSSAQYGMCSPYLQNVFSTEISATSASWSKEGLGRMFPLNTNSPSPVAGLTNRFATQSEKHEGNRTNPSRFYPLRRVRATSHAKSCQASNSFSCTRCSHFLVYSLQSESESVPTPNIHSIYIKSY